MLKISKDFLNKIINDASTLETFRDISQKNLPSPLQIRTVGHSLTELEWAKYCRKYLVPNKLEQYCERRQDGVLVFHGEGGLDAALAVQKKFNKHQDRFHFIISSDFKDKAMQAYDIARELGLKVLNDIEFKDKHKSKFLP